MGQEISSRFGAPGAEALETVVEGGLAGEGSASPPPPPPPPRFSSTIWLASCRPAGRLSRFAQPLLYQPDTRLFCPHGLSCRQRQVDPAHARLCIHTQEAMDGSAKTSTELVNPAPTDMGGDEAPGDSAFAKQTDGDGINVEDDDDVEENTDNEDEDGGKDDGGDTSPLWIPHVRYAYDVSEAALADPNADALAGLPRNRTVVIYVHGFRADDLDTHSFRTIGCLLHLQLRLREGQAALQHRCDDVPDTKAGDSDIRDSAAAAVADAVGAAAARQRHEDWDGWAAAQHPVIAGGLLTDQGRRVRLSSHESEDIVLSAPNSPVPHSNRGEPPSADDVARDETASEHSATPETQRRAIMRRRAATAASRTHDDSEGDDSGAIRGGVTSGEDEDAPIIMGFVWPCHNKTTAYRKARDKADRAGAVLRPLLQALSARGNNTLIVAHSMGSRVALTALMETEPAPAPDIIFDNPINSPEPELEPEPQSESVLPPLPLPRPRPRELPAPAIPEAAAGHSAAYNDAVVAEGTVFWREGEGIVPAADAATVANDLNVEAATDCTSPSRRESTEAVSNWTCDGTEQTPPATPILGSRLANVGSECVSDSTGADRPATNRLVSHVFLLAGAVSADALHPGRGEFSIDRLRATNVTVAYSSNDSVSWINVNSFFSFQQHLGYVIELILRVCGCVAGLARCFLGRGVDASSTCRRWERDEDQPTAPLFHS